MTSIHLDIAIANDPARVWDAVRDVGHLHERFAAGFVTDTQLDGDERVVTFANGVVAREQILDIDDDRRRVAYAIVESPAALTYHHGAFLVLPAEDGSPDRCRLIWDVDLLPAEAAPLIEAMMVAGGEAAAATLAADANATTNATAGAAVGGGAGAGAGTRDS
jgi:hypothetical protein